MTTKDILYESPGTIIDDFRNQQPEEPNEVPVPHKDPTTVPGKEPKPDVWPHKDPEITPGEEPLTKPATAPPEIPKPPEYETL